MKPRCLRAFWAGLVFLAAILTVPPQASGDEEVIERVMKSVFKGEESPLKKVIAGSADSAQVDFVAGELERLAAAKPERGSVSSWEEKTKELLVAMKAIKDKQEGAGDLLKDAARCKSCHLVHKED
jgi:hypothetical protein